MIFVFVEIKTCWLSIISGINLKIHETLEAMNFSIRFGNKNIAFLPVHRPPPHDHNEEIFFNELGKTVNELESKNDEIIIIGDLNCNLFEKENNKLVDFSIFVKEPFYETADAILLLKRRRKLIGIKKKTKRN